MLRALQIIVFLLSSLASFTLMPPMTTTPHANAISEYHLACDGNRTRVNSLSAEYTSQYGDFQDFGPSIYITSCDNSLFFLKYDPSKTFREMKTDGWNIVGRESVTYSHKSDNHKPHLTLIFNIVENSSGEKRRTITSSERIEDRVFYMTEEPNTSSCNESLWSEAENTQPGCIRPVARAVTTLLVTIALYQLIMLMFDAAKIAYDRKQRNKGRFSLSRK